MTEFDRHLDAVLAGIEAEGLMKRERALTSPQAGRVTVGGREMLNLCANNYLGLADDPRLVAAATRAMEDHGYGMASVRFICGTQGLHRELETRLAGFLGREDAILFAACFDANGGVFEPLLGPEDAIVSDALNHASIIDGIRLCKAKRYRYANSDMDELEAQLKAARTEGARFVMIATDGVFSMDGYLAKLPEIRALADRYDALVMVDDSHATGFIGPTGRGSAEHHGVMDKIDIFTSTLGKALGGASGGFTTGRQAIIDLLRQRSRPYLFSNTLPPPLVAAAIRVFGMLSGTTELRDRLEANTRYFREQMTQAGFDIKPGIHPIVPVMLYEAPLAQEFAARLLQTGIYVTGFFFPVVPRGEARIRVQISAAHHRHHLDQAVAAFSEVGRDLGVLKDAS